MKLLDDVFKKLTKKKEPKSYKVGYVCYYCHREFPSEKALNAHGKSPEYKEERLRA